MNDKNLLKRASLYADVLHATYGSGMSAFQAGNVCGLSPNTVVKYWGIINSGIQRTRPVRQHKHAEAMIKMWRSGDTYTSIGARFNMSRQAAHQIIHHTLSLQQSNELPAQETRDERGPETAGPDEQAGSQVCLPAGRTKAAG